MRETVRWSAFGASVRGASHEVHDEPNEDCVGWNDADGVLRPLVLAVADGHGSPACFRSGTGARLAVRAAENVLGALAALPADPQDCAALARRIVEAWRSDVASHRLMEPFDEHERAKISGNSEDAELLAYGSTLLAIAVHGNRMLFAQIGDGDILAADDDGRTIRIFPKDPALAVHETNSLCEAQAWRKFRIITTAPGERLPALTIAATDGYANSFATDPDFLKVGTDFVTLVRHNGTAAIWARLEKILDSTSRPGSRDDITAGILTRIPAPALPAAERKTEHADVRAPAPRASLFLSLVIVLVLGGAIALLFGPGTQLRHILLPVSHPRPAHAAAHTVNEGGGPHVI